MADEPDPTDETPTGSGSAAGLQRKRRAVRVEELSEEEIAAIAAAEVDPRYAHLDEELRNWRP